MPIFCHPRAGGDPGASPNILDPRLCGDDRTIYITEMGSAAGPEGRRRCVAVAVVATASCGASR